jgi:hypothetical protein
LAYNIAQNHENSLWIKKSDPLGGRSHSGVWLDIFQLVAMMENRKSDQKAGTEFRPSIPRECKMVSFLSCNAEPADLLIPSEMRHGATKWESGCPLHRTVEASAFGAADDRYALRE